MKKSWLYEKSRILLILVLLSILGFSNYVLLSDTFFEKEKRGIDKKIELENSMKEETSSKQKYMPQKEYADILFPVCKNRIQNINY